MKSNQRVVYFVPGKESGPWSTKMIVLADIARAKGFQVEIPDYSDLPDPDLQVERLVELCGGSNDVTVLVASNMGGYESAVASSAIKPAGLFLLAPAFYLPGYQEQEPVPCCSMISIIHGWDDDVVPVDNSIRFARKHKTDLCLVDGDHRLTNQLPVLEQHFALFLDRIIEHGRTSSDPAGGKLRWRDVAHAVKEVLRVSGNYLEPQMEWLQRVWNRIESQGDADYADNHERQEVILRLTSLVDFLRDIMNDDHTPDWHEYVREQYENGELRIRVDRLFSLTLGEGESQGCEEHSDRNIDDTGTMELLRAYAHAIHNVVHPAILKEFGSLEWIAKTVCQTMYPNSPEFFSGEYLEDPEESKRVEKIEETEEYRFILGWVQCQLTHVAALN